VHFYAYICRVGIHAGLIVAVAMPVVLVAVWHSRVRRWNLLLLVASLVVVHDALMWMPRQGVFERLHWSWQECLLATIWPFVLTAIISGVTLRSIGVSMRLRPGWLKPSLVALLLAVAVPAVFFLLGVRKKLDTEGWVFLSTMPGLAEELVYRGVFQSLLNSVFGKSWTLANGQFGWGLFVTAILFAGTNGLVDVDSQLHGHLILHAAIAPFLLSLVSGWVRERTDSVWPSVFGHNLSNIVVPVASLFV
jgi:membrane protease YdiL (CAAX protease family)